MIINLRGEGIYFPPIINTKNPIDKNMTIGELYNMIIKSFRKILPPGCTPYIYIIPSDICCGFVPLPTQKIEELWRLYGENDILIIKITDRAFYG